VNENYKEINVQDQEQDENSVLNFYRRAVQLRKNLSCVRHGNYKEYGKMSSKLFAYSREDDKQKILVVCSFTEKHVKFKAPAGFDVKDAELVLCNYTQGREDTLNPYETRVYLWKE
jgi:oligo-1,6-glucosidase